jgi:adenosylcobinamide-GDP ribazoletransferase
MGDGLRLAMSLLTILPVRTERVDRETARWAMLLAPVAGLVVGGAAAVVLVLADALRLGGLLGAALAVATMAALTRALHLDGLADLADGLGSGKPAAPALEVMKRSDIGPFGVVTLLLTLLVQTAAIAGQHPYGVIIAGVTGRLALVWACRAGVPAARPGGLGALVAGTVSTGQAVAVTAVVLATAAVTGALFDGVQGLALAGSAVLAGLGAACLVLRHAVRRLTGVTGDVLGALVEIAATVALIALAVDETGQAWD